jgi:hypothetical protein
MSANLLERVAFLKRYPGHHVCNVECRGYRFEFFFFYQVQSFKQSPLISKNELDIRVAVDECPIKAASYSGTSCHY